jgi:hypothetical protein
MPTIETRVAPDGTTSYRVKIRRKGAAQATASFARKTDAKKWVQDTDSAIRNDRYFKGAAATFSNTENDGPVVINLPPAVAGAGFYGTIMDAWQVPLADIGVGGKGGKYLLLPPRYKGTVPSGYIPLHLKTYNSSALVRSILASDSDEDVRKGDALVKRIKVYPLSKAAAPPPERFIDMTDILYDPAVSYDTGFYVSRPHDQRGARATEGPRNAGYAPPAWDRKGEGI